MLYFFKDKKNKFLSFCLGSGETFISFNFINNNNEKIFLKNY